MRKKSLLYLLSLVFLFSCGGTNSSSSTETVSTSSVDYSLFDSSIIGTWYVHQSMMGLSDINETITITDSYIANFLGVNFSFVGIYEDFEGTCLFRSELGTVDFVVSYDGDGNLDWAITDTQGNQDWGYAKKEEHISGIQYSYEGESWPMEQIKEYLGTTKSLPIYEHTYYYLFTGISQLYGDASLGNDKYCMIDLYGVSLNAIDLYTQELIDAGYTMSTNELTFYQGYDDEHIYSIRLKQFEDNLCIFVYYYSTFYSD